MTYTLAEVTTALIAMQISWGGIAALIAASHAGALDRLLCPHNLNFPEA